MRKIEEQDGTMMLKHRAEVRLRQGLPAFSRSLPAGWFVVALVALVALEVAGERLRGPAPVLASVNRVSPVGAVIDNPVVSISNGATVTSSTPTSGTSTARVAWNFGAVQGAYSGCTAQAQTSYDGTNFVNLGAAAPLVVASNTLNAWAIFELPLTAAVVNPADTSGIAVTAVSSGTVPGNFVGSSVGALTRFSFSCASYGSSAPVTISVSYR